MLRHFDQLSIAAKGRARWKRIYPGPRPPSGLIAIAVQLAVMEATDGDRVLVADFSAERARLGEANMMRLARPPAADDALLCGDELAVLLVAQADGLWGQPTTASLPGQDDRRGSRGRRSIRRMVLRPRPEGSALSSDPMARWRRPTVPR